MFHETEFHLRRKDRSVDEVFNLIRSLIRPHNRGGGVKQPFHEEIIPDIDTTKLPPELREAPPLLEESIENWINLPRRFEHYSPGTTLDGTSYKGGKIMYIGENQVMGDFEEPWCKATSEVMFNGKRGPLNVFEAGFGMGILAKYNLEEVRSRGGGKYYIIELNRQVYQEDLLPWVNQQQEILNNDPDAPSIEIIPIYGEAGEILRSDILKDELFDIFSSDTFYLQNNHKGINDLIYLDEVAKHSKKSTRFGFCPFHKGNQTPSIDIRQYTLLTKYFRKYDVETVSVVPPKECTYLEGPRILPAVAFKDFKKTA